MIGQAAHIVDSIHWFMNSGIPSAVVVGGGRPNLVGVEVPETTTMCLEYPENYLATFTVGYKAMRYSGTLDQLVQYNGSKARFDVGRESYSLYPEAPRDVEMKPSVHVSRPGSFGSATRQHIRNFLEAVKTRQQPSAPPAAAQSTNIVLCMAMQSVREGKRLRWNAAAKKVV